MFVRFYVEARQVVVDAQFEARRLHHEWIGCEHFLLALTRRPSDVGELFTHYGITSAAADEAIAENVGPMVSDSDALAAIGINLDDVRAHIEAAFGPGALEPAMVTKRRWPRRGRSERRGACRAMGVSTGAMPFSPRAKRCLELAAIAAAPGLGRPTHLADALAAHSDTVAGQVLGGLGVDVARLRVDLARLHG